MKDLYFAPRKIVLLGQHINRTNYSGAASATGLQRSVRLCFPAGGRSLGTFRRPGWEPPPLGAHPRIPHRGPRRRFLPDSLYFSGNKARGRPPPPTTSGYQWANLPSKALPPTTVTTVPAPSSQLQLALLLLRQLPLPLPSPPTAPSSPSPHNSPSHPLPTAPSPHSFALFLSPLPAAPNTHLTMPTLSSLDRPTGHSS